jgi:uncharacterized membrane protein YkoI
MHRHQHMQRQQRAGRKLPALRVAAAALSAVALLSVVLLSRPAISAESLQPRQGDAPIGLREPPRSVPGLSMDQAIEIAEQRYRARVVRANAVEANGRRIYVLRLLSDEGRVWTIRVDAQTGGGM